MRHLPAPCGHTQAGSIVIEAVFALVVLGGAALLCLHVGWQSLQSQVRVQQWHDAIDALDNAANSLHLWPQSAAVWATPVVAVGTATSSAVADACTTSPCALDDWQLAQAQGLMQALGPSLPSAELTWQATAPLSWQAGEGKLSLPMGQWQLRWGSGNNPAASPSTTLLLVSTP